MPYNRKSNTPRQTQVNNAGDKAIDKVLSELHRQGECNHCDELRGVLNVHEIHRLGMSLEG
jgi:hypothetical protein